MHVLRQSTASQEILLGPFVDSADGNTAEDSLTIANTDIKVWKSGATTLANKNSGGATHISGGYYYAVLDATDTDTVGMLEVHVKVAGALAVAGRFQVVEEAIYDAIYAASATGLLPANVTQFGGSNGTFASGRPEVNTTHFGGLAATVSSGRPEVNMTHIAGSTVSASTAQLGVNVVNWGGTPVGSVTFGVNVTQISGDTTAADNLEAALDGTGGVTITAALTGAITGSLSGSVGSVTGNVGGNVTGSIGSLAAQAKADVNAEVDSAIETYHLDHLFQTTYDPASKPGAADALLNELVESDAGVARFTANALEQGPSGGGGGGDATEANQTTIIAHLVEMKGATFVEATDSLEALRNRGDAAWTTATGFSTHAAADVWSVGTRTLTAGTNIVLAKGTGVTGFNDLSAAQVNSEVDTALADYDGPTNTEMEARTLAAASYATAASIAALPTAAEIFAAVATSALTEAYAADGAAPTLAQAIFAIQQRLTEFAISGTTLTVKKLDGSTTALVLTLNDATTPTSSTRSS
jgi:hypothetical protein